MLVIPFIQRNSMSLSVFSLLGSGFTSCLEQAWAKLLTDYDSILKFLTIVLAIFVSLPQKDHLHSTTSIGQNYPGLQNRCSQNANNIRAPHLYTSITALCSRGRRRRLSEWCFYLPCLLLLIQLIFLWNRTLLDW